MPFVSWWEKHKNEVGEGFYVAERWAKRAWDAATEQAAADCEECDGWDMNPKDYAKMIRNGNKGGGE